MCNYKVLSRFVQQILSQRCIVLNILNSCKIHVIKVHILVMNRSKQLHIFVMCLQFYSFHSNINLPSYVLHWIKDYNIMSIDHILKTRLPTSQHILLYSTVMVTTFSSLLLRNRISCNSVVFELPNRILLIHLQCCYCTHVACLVALLNYKLNIVSLCLFFCQALSQCR